MGLRIGSSSEPVGAHELAVVVPVYGGATTLPGLLAELESYTTPALTRAGRPFLITEIFLVDDNGSVDCAPVIRELATKYTAVRPIWLSRNYGQHAATLAGMASSSAEWIVTMDEDGQHDPAAIGDLLDAALDEQRSLVYAKPTNPPPHGPVRNRASALVKWLATRVLARGSLGDYHSFRLVLGEVGRSVAAYCGDGVYLDVALSWVVERPAICPVAMRAEGDRRSGYGFRRLLSHFWRLVLTSGTRPLRFISLLGVALGLGGLLITAYVLWSQLTRDIPVQGWTSVIIAILISSGAILFSLGVISEYLGAAVRMALGKPPYLIVADPATGPLGRARRTAHGQSSGPTSGQISDQEDRGEEPALVSPLRRR